MPGVPSTGTVLLAALRAGAARFVVLATLRATLRGAVAFRFLAATLALLALAGFFFFTAFLAAAFFAAGFFVALCELQLVVLLPHACSRCDQFVLCVSGMEIYISKSYFAWKSYV